jgi:hypothetical protein
MSRSLVHRLLATAAVVLAGALASVTAASPADAATVPTVTLGVHDQHCLPNGQIDVIFELENHEGFEIKLTAFGMTPDGDLDTPVGTLVADGGSRFIVDTVGPNFSGAVSLTVHWISNVVGTAGSGEVSSEIVVAACPQRVEAEFTSNCDGTTNVTLFNHTDSSQTFLVNDLPPIDVPGLTNKDVPNVPANGSGIVSVSIVFDDDGHEQLIVHQFKWTAPRDCPTPSPSPSPSNLVNTGTSVTGVVGLGAGLVLGGVVLLLALVLLRRRRAASGS